MFICTVCKSDNIMQDAWVDVNFDEIAQTFDTFWCVNCEGECVVEEIDNA